jgi:hypothetical protein
MNSSNYSSSFVKPWLAVNLNKDYLERELLSELSSKHILYGKKVNAIAYRQDMDDVLFEIFESENSYAIVHLTHRFESDPKWPLTRLYKNWDEVNLQFKEDHKGWEDEIDDE